jgi:hypothetical protein
VVVAHETHADPGRFLKGAISATWSGRPSPALPSPFKQNIPQASCASIPRAQSKFSLTAGSVGRGRLLHRKRKEIDMSKYFNVTTPVTGNDGKTRFHKVGVAFPQAEDARSVMTIRLFATPTNGELVLFAPNSGSEGNSDSE